MSKVVGKSQSEVASLKANNAVAALKAVPEGQFKAAINAIPTYNRTVEARMFGPAVCVRADSVPSPAAP